MIKILAVGKIKEDSLQKLIAEYAKRMKSIHKVEMIELSNSKIHERNVDAVINDESQRILEKIKNEDFVILLDLKGKDYDSPALSNEVMKVLDLGLSLTFVIGGSHGVNRAIRERANIKWRISNLTFPHQVVRLLLYEQLYLSFMIERNHPYHKGIGCKSLQNSVI